ncbi:carbamoyltransferase C-terminal domain-containing protein [Candidatus Pelagibacter sp. HIMB1495]|uniref:carbamoyltransferase C-terminal domain-containing protein n=1 Tax=unclassified Candidatus Pelagibacter TaxID=2647897 RepID=UPI003F831186
MKIIGTKYSGLESAVSFLDTKSDIFFALQSDRVSRIKKDNIDIDQTLKYLNSRELIPNEVDVVAIPFSNFSGKDGILEMQSPTFFFLKKEKVARKYIKPKYFSDLINVDIKTIAISKKDIRWQYYSLMHKFFSNFRKVENLNKFFVKKTISNIFKTNNITVPKIEFYDHHLSHAASCLTIDDFDLNKTNYIFVLDEHGDLKHSSFFKWSSEKFELISSSKITKFNKDNRDYITSIGSLYSNFTEALDLRRSVDEGKVEALAAYGVPNKNLLKILRRIIKINNANLNFLIDTKLYKKFLIISNLKKYRKIIGDKNFAATIQYFLEKIVVEMLSVFKSIYNFDKIYLTGGVFANVILSYKVYSALSLKSVNVVPYMGDEGSSVGAAVLSLINNKEDPLKIKKVSMPYLGDSYNDQETLSILNLYKNSINFENLKDNWVNDAANSLKQNKIIATFYGKMEFGPRALGQRSILANPFYKDTRDKINLQIKKRPWYQPLCPTILEEDREEIFEQSFHHKYMSTAFKAKSRFKEIIPSALHVDLTARPQFVTKETNFFFWNLLKKIKDEYKYGVVLNTSFNLHGRTNVLRPEDAIVDFLDCNLDALYINNYRVTKKI